MKLTNEQRERLLNYARHYGKDFYGGDHGIVSVERRAKFLIEYVEEITGGDPKVVTAVEELRALAPGTVILAADGRCYEARIDAHHAETYFRGFNGGNYVMKRDHEAFLPATILHTPEVTE